MQKARFADILNSNEVIRVIKAALARRIASIKPIGSNHCEQYAARGHLLPQHFYKVGAGRDRINVHEDAFSRHEMR
jgi:hypothetical protein